MSWRVIRNNDHGKEEVVAEVGTKSAAQEIVAQLDDRGEYMIVDRAARNRWWAQCNCKQCSPRSPDAALTIHARIVWTIVAAVGLALLLDADPEAARRWGLSWTLAGCLPAVYGFTYLLAPRTRRLPPPARVVRRR